MEIGVSKGRWRLMEWEFDIELILLLLGMGSCTLHGVLARR